MGHVRSPPGLSFFLITILLVVCHIKCEARDSINASNPLSDNGETIVSAGNIYELGFFSPEGNESSRYVGVWYYNLLPRTVVWVANRNDPLLDSCGSFGIKDDGNVRIWCGNEEIVPITSLESARNSNRTLRLSDLGNLILDDGQSGSDSSLWQSFHYPTDTFLPGMKLNDDVILTSWISPTDPGIGDFTFRQDQGLYVMQNRSVVYWKSGEPGPFKTDDGLPIRIIHFLSGLDQKNNSLQGNTTRDGQHIPLPNDTSFSYSISRLVMNVQGVIRYYSLDEDRSWLLVWIEPQDYCSIYNACGKFGICNMAKRRVCHCPTGFKPVSSEDWMTRHYSEGCDRESTKCSVTGNFSNISLVNVGGQATPFDQAKSENDCMEECLHDCDCEAYLFRNHSERGSVNSAPKCWIWTTDLKNLHQDDTGGRINLSIRVHSLSTVSVDGGDDSKAPKNKSQKRYVIVIPVIVAGVILLSCFSCILYKRRKAKLPENRESTGAPSVLFSNDSERRVNDLMQENDKRIDVPFYKLDVILSATDNFADVNKLGQGGFGPVYKGMFPGGHEIAVKRLSSFSAQGIEEFLNEVVLIAKLQHRNLVRLLGYCIKGNEKILLYEYMPNRSLDAFIFDQHNCLLLDWKKRFDIILGIARGLLYLHQDSRLRIIHRDLKTSNILLDEDMNPKISDFGLARIVEGKGTEASTNKVVGTYGYMSPEYALDGKFSVKSDVFSFGVVMLEIISGRKNTGFYNPHEVLNLLGYAWRLWCDDKALDLIDPTLLELSEESQVMRCINIGLLCVQEDPGERPSMSTVVIMLGSESTTPLPCPTQPAFVLRRGISTTSSSSSTKQGVLRVLSHNEMTISQVKGR